MKARNFLAFLMVSISAICFAQNEKQYLIQSLNFAAPVVMDTPSTTDNPLGAIVFDASSGSFKGLFAGGWGNITQGTLKLPVVHTFTTGVNTYNVSNPRPLYIKVSMSGGGGGGGSGSDFSPNGNPGVRGGDTIFGTSPQSVVASGGNPGTAGGFPGSGNANSTPGFTVTVIKDIKGGTGGGASTASATTNLVGGVGAPGIFGGSGTANTGAGGNGGGFAGANVMTAGNTGSGGAAGSYFEFYITENFANSYLITVGAGGAGGTGPGGGSGAASGASGSSGIVVVEEFFQ